MLFLLTAFFLLKAIAKIRIIFDMANILMKSVCWRISFVDLLIPFRSFERPQCGILNDVLQLL